MRALFLSCDFNALTRCNNSYGPPHTHGVPCKRCGTTCPITARVIQYVRITIYIYHESGLYGSKMVLIPYCDSGSVSLWFGRGGPLFTAKIGPGPLFTQVQFLYDSPSSNPLQCVGECNIPLQHRERSCTQQLFIVKGLRSNLLGLPAIRAH